ncbi:MAG: flagellar biosynthesis protein FlhF [Pseudomonadota bacterium]|jgi:flagellar biosynthesis protein FlhF
MNIRKYTARNMREALAQVRVAQGGEAVILGERRVDEGVEVIAADDYDPALYQEAMRQWRATHPAANEAAPPVAERPAPVTAPPASAARPVEVAVSAPPPVQVVHTQEPAVLALRSELAELRDMLERGFGELSRRALAQRDPVRARVVGQLEALGMTAAAAALVADGLPQELPASLGAAAGRDSWRLPLSLLARRLPLTDDGLLTRGGCFALVGPTGVGKTTTIAKLAARHAAEYGPEGVALITTDHYRAGAREQLQVHATQLGISLQVARSGEELAGMLDRLSRRRLVLVDTGGMAPRDLRFHEQARVLASVAGRLQVLLVLAANAGYEAMEAATRAARPLAPVAAVLTKLDEAGRLGGALSLLLNEDLAVAHLCDGQRIPEDLHAAYPRRVWLVREALRRLREPAAPAAVAAL